MKPVAFIDLFCGMGGFTGGAINAGATCIVSVDYWIMERHDPLHSLIHDAAHEALTHNDVVLLSVLDGYGVENLGGGVSAGAHSGNPFIQRRVTESKTHSP